MLRINWQEHDETRITLHLRANSTNDCLPQARSRMFATFLLLFSFYSSRFIATVRVEYSITFACAGETERERKAGSTFDVCLFSPFPRSAFYWFYSFNHSIIRFLTVSSLMNSIYPWQFACTDSPNNNSCEKRILLSQCKQYKRTVRFSNLQTGRRGT